ncbi:MAG: hypothetical protein K8I82_12230 [Anaerolineae bacterium]|jgi:hypothetical protein|nr:hypothetical protein [Anaerolineae bacterium]
MEEKSPPTVGAPTELAEVEEVPGWFAGLVEFLMAGPVILAFLCGGLPMLAAACYCVAQLFFI